MITTREPTWAHYIDADDCEGRVTFVTNGLNIDYRDEQLYKWFIHSHVSGDNAYVFPDSLMIYCYYDLQDRELRFKIDYGKSSAWAHYSMRVYGQGVVNLSVELLPFRWLAHAKLNGIYELEAA